MKKIKKMFERIWTRIYNLIVGRLDRCSTTLLYTFSTYFLNQSSGKLLLQPQPSDKWSISGFNAFTTLLWRNGLAGRLKSCTLGFKSSWKPIKIFFLVLVYVVSSSNFQAFPYTCSTTEFPGTFSRESRPWSQIVDSLSSGYLIKFRNKALFSPMKSGPQKIVDTFGT